MLVGYYRVLKHCNGGVKNKYGIVPIGGEGRDLTQNPNFLYKMLVHLKPHIGVIRNLRI